MRILIITQYFWPENFKINSLVLELNNNGHDVTVLTGLPNYPTGKISSGYSFWKNNKYMIIVSNLFKMIEVSMICI